jgi:hypothetical protein
MNGIIIANDVLAFIIELIALAGFGYLGTMFSNNKILQTIGAVVCVGIMVVLWGAFFAPKADYRLTMPWLFVGKLIILLMPGYILLYKKNFTWALIWVAVVILHLVVATLQNQM